MHKGEAMFLQGVLARVAGADVETIYIQRCEAGIRVTLGARAEGETKERTVQFFLTYLRLEVLRAPNVHGWRRAEEALQRLGVS